MMHNSSCLAGATLLAYLQTRQGKLDGNVLNVLKVLIRTDPWLLLNPRVCTQRAVPPAELTADPTGSRPPTRAARLVGFGSSWQVFS